jgi:nitroreductase
MEPKAMLACGQLMHTVDVSIAFAYIILQAYELGLGTCWIGAFEEDEAKKILNVPEHVRVVAMTPLGYPDQPPSQKSRKSLDQIVCYEKYEI